MQHMIVFPLSVAIICRELHLPIFVVSITLTALTRFSNCGKNKREEECNPSYGGANFATFSLKCLFSDTSDKFLRSPSDPSHDALMEA